MGSYQPTDQYGGDGAGVLERCSVMEAPAGFPLYVLTGTTIYGLFTSGTTMCFECVNGK